MAAYPYQSYQGNGVYQQGGFYQPQYQQPIQPNIPQFGGYNQQMQGAQPQPVMQNGLIWVSGIDEVNQFPVAPNNSVRLWHKTKPIVYFKTADASGRPVVEAYDLHKRTELDDSEPEKRAEEYALKSELASFASAVSGINQIVSALKTDVDAIKGDMYGVVGKKKPTKKSVTEETDDE